MFHVDKFLEDSQSGRLIDEQKAFSINHKRALEMAGKVQLPEPRAYILKLVQWAVASQPKLVRVTTTGGDVTIEHNGRPLSADENQGLRAGKMDFSSLTLGVYGALGLSPQELFVESEDGGFDLVSGTETKPTGCEPGWTRVVVKGVPKRWFEQSPMVRRALRDWWVVTSLEGPVQRLLMDATGLNGLEYGLVRTFGSLSPTPIELNGKIINSVFGPGAGAFRAWWDGATLHLYDHGMVSGTVFLNFCLDESPGEVLVPLQLLHGPHCKWLNLANGDSMPPAEAQALGFEESSFSLNGQRLVKARGVHRPVSGGTNFLRLLVIRDGIIIDQVKLKGLKGLAIFSSDQLKVSVDGFRLVQDEFFQNWLARLTEVFTRYQITTKDFREAEKGNA